MSNHVIIGMMIAAIIAGALGLYLRRKTIIYVDVSGSMINLQPVMKGKLNAMLGLRYNRFNTVLKPFDHMVHGAQPFTRAAVDVVTSYNGGGSFIDKVVDDYKASKVKSAIVLTEGVLFEDQRLAEVRDVKIVEIA